MFFCLIWCIGAFIPPSVSETEEADINMQNIEYDRTTDSARFMLILEDTRRLIELDFKGEITHIFEPDSPHFEECEKRLEVGYSEFSKIIDRFGGVELSIPFICKGVDNLPRRYTGSQISAVLKSRDIPENDKNSLITDVIVNIFKNISVLGLWEEDFEYIINMSKSNISVVDYHNTVKYLQTAFAECDIYE